MKMMLELDRAPALHSWQCSKQTASARWPAAQAAGHSRRRLVTPLDEIDVHLAIVTSKFVYKALVCDWVAAAQAGSDVLGNGDRLQCWIALAYALEALLEVT